MMLSWQPSQKMTENGVFLKNLQEILSLNLSNMYNATVTSSMLTKNWYHIYTINKSGFRDVAIAEAHIRGMTAPRS